MTLAIACRVPEGIILGIDSRVTSTIEHIEGKKTYYTHKSFDHATKLIQIPSQTHIAAIIYGTPAIGSSLLQTPPNMMSEFEQSLPKKRLTVKDFAHLLRDFYTKKWNEYFGPGNSDNPVGFIIAGFDEDMSHGRIYKIEIPLDLKEELTENNSPKFGMIYQGQYEIIQRLIEGYNPEILGLLDSLGVELTLQQKHGLKQVLNLSGLQILYPWLPIESATEFVRFLINVTFKAQTWQKGHAYVGQPIHVLTITQREGVKEAKVNLDNTWTNI